MKLTSSTGAVLAVFIALSLSGCGDGSPETETSADPDTGAAADSHPEAQTDPGAGPSASDDVVDLPGDSQPGDDHLDAMTGGVLAADDEDCVWLIDPPVKDEPFDPKVALIWPGGYTFDTSTQEILDPAGEVVATIGRQVRLGGGETPHLASQWPERCGAADRVWAVAPMEERG